MGLVIRKGLLIEFSGGNYDHWQQGPFVVLKDIIVDHVKDQKELIYFLESNQYILELDIVSWDVDLQVDPYIPDNPVSIDIGR